MFFFICVWINDWVNNREAGDLRRHRGHYDVIVMHITEIDKQNSAVTSDYMPGAAGWADIAIKGRKLTVMAINVIADGSF